MSTSTADVVRIDSKAAKERVEQAERVPIFELDGTVYDVAKVDRADLALEYLNRIEQDGADEAAAWMIRQTVGSDGFDALRGVVGLSQEDWQGILDRIEAIVTPKARARRRRD